MSGDTDRQQPAIARLGAPVKWASLVDLLVERKGAHSRRGQSIRP